MNKYYKDGKTINYQVIEKKIKHSYIKIRNGFLLISKSYNMSLGHILKQIDKKFDYYYEKLISIDKSELSLWGEVKKINLIKSEDFSYKLVENKITVLTNINDYNKIKILILTKELEKYLINNRKKHQKILIANNLFEVPIKLKSLSSKFGSYNYNAREEYIVLNIYLATLKEEYANYVLFHEYAHQKVKNHQKEFYDLLKKLVKNYQIYQKGLRKKTLNF